MEPIPPDGGAGSGEAARSAEGRPGSVAPNARVLLVGINAYEAQPLNGCVNDVLALRNLLVSLYGIGEERIRLLIDEQATKQAIEDGLRWLAEPDANGQPCVRYFHFSGRGSAVADTHGTQSDGRAETLVPYDYQTAGMLRNDGINASFDALDAGTQLVRSVDCGYATIFWRNAPADRLSRDLPVNDEEQQAIDAAKHKYDAEMQQYVMACLTDLKSRSVPQEEWEARIKAATAEFEQKRFGMGNQASNVVLISACRTSETAGEARFGDVHHGAFSFFLLEVLRETRGVVTYNELIERIGRGLYDNKFLQVPQLECAAELRDQRFLTIPVQA